MDALTWECEPFYRSTCWSPLAKGYREPLAQNPESGGICGFWSSEGMVIEKAEVGLWCVIKRTLLRTVTAIYSSFGGSEFQV